MSHRLLQLLGMLEMLGNHILDFLNIIDINLIHHYSRDHLSHSIATMPRRSMIRWVSLRNSYTQMFLVGEYSLYPSKFRYGTRTDHLSLALHDVQDCLW